MHTGLDTFMDRIRTRVRTRYPRGHFGPHTLGMFYRLSTVVRLVDIGLDTLYHHWSFDTHLLVRLELARVVLAIKDGIQASIPDEEFRFEVR